MAKGEVDSEFRSNGKTMELDDFDILAINSRRKKFLESLLESSSPLLDSTNNEALQFQVGISEARSKVQQLRPLPNKQSCVFCRKNNEEYKTYSTHLVKNRLGEVTCPILQKYRCPYCGATGKHAHTIKYCPKYDGLSTVDALLRTPRNGFGKRRLEFSSRRASFAETVVSGESPIREKYHSEALPTSPLISCREKSGRKGFFSRPLMRLSGYRTKLDSSPKKELPFTNLMKKPSSPVKAQLSQGTQKPTQESQLDSTGPIFPDLIGCCKPLDDILPQLTSSLGYRGLCQLMKGRNLNTIGDLSSLTEVQINQLPIRNPKVQPVKTTLTSYMGKHGLLKVPICEETKEALTSQPTIEDGPENVKPDEINQDQRSGTVSQDLPGENDIEQISVQEKADSQAPNVNSLVLSTLSNLKGTDLKKYQHIPAL